MRRVCWILNLVLLGLFLSFGCGPSRPAQKPNTPEEQKKIDDEMHKRATGPKR